MRLTASRLFIILTNVSAEGSAIGCEKDHIPLAHCGLACGERRKVRNYVKYGAWTAFLRQITDGVTD